MKRRTFIYLYERGEGNKCKFNAVKISGECSARRDDFRRNVDTLQLRGIIIPGDLGFKGETMAGF